MEKKVKKKESNNKMVVATLESEHYTYMALGKTVNEAKEAIRERWNKYQRHLQQNGVINEPYLYSNINAMENDYDIETVILKPNECKMW